MGDDDDDSTALSPETTASIASPEATEDEEQQCSIKREKRHSSEDSTIDPVVPSRFHQAASAPMSPSVQNSSLREDSSDETPPSKLEDVSTSPAQQALRGTNNSQTQGRTCVACRKSKVKCSRGSPCDRCARLKLECVAQTRGRGRPVASNKRVKLDTALPRSTPVFRTPTGATPTKSIGRKTGGLPEACVGGNSKHSSFMGTSENPRLNRAPTRSSLAVPSMAVSAVGRREDTGSFQGFPGDVAPHHSVMGSAAPAGYTDPIYSSSDGYRGGSSVISSSMGTPGGDDGGEGVGNGSGGGGRGDIGGAEIHPSHSQLTVEQHAQMSTLDASRFSGVGASGLSTGLAPQLNGVLSMAFFTPRPSGHQIHDGSGGEYGMSGGSWQSNGNGGGIGGPFSGVAGRGTDSNGQQNSPPPAWEDIHSASQMDRVANGGGNGHGNSNGGSGGTFDRETMRNRSDGRAGTGGVVVPLEARRSSLPSGVLESMGSSTASGNGNVGGSGSGGENGRDNSSIWADSMVDSDNTPNTSSDTGSAAGVVTASGVATAAGSRNQASSVTGTKHGRSPRWVDDIQRGITAVGSSAFSSGTSLTRKPDSHQAEEVTRLRVDPTETIVEGFWRLYNEQAIHRSKAVLVIRHWALCALDRRSKKLMHKTVEMAKALCINVLEVLNDYGIYAMFHELLCEAEAGTKVSPAPRVWFEHQVKASPYIEELSSVFAAVSIRVVLRGQSCFYHNEKCRELFMSSEDANLMYAANEQDVWSTFVHPDDHKAFFDTFSMELFRAPAPFSEFTSIFKFRDRLRGAFLALVHIRYEFQDDGNYAAFGLCVRPLPSSKYLLEPGPPENGHTRVPPTTSASVSASSPSPPSTVVPGHSIMIGSNGSVGGVGFLPPVDFSTGGSLAVSAANAAVASVAGTSDVNRRSPLPHLDMEMQRRVSSLHGAGSTEASGAGGGEGWGGVSCPETYNGKDSASTDDSQQQQQQQRPAWGPDAGGAPVGGSASSSGIAGPVTLSNGLQSRGVGAGMASASGQGGDGRPGAGSGGGVVRNMHGSWTATGGEGRDKSVTARMRMTQAGGGGANGLQTAVVMSPKGPGPPSRSRKV